MSDAPPSPANLEFLADGARLFPRELGLLADVATLHLKHDQPDVARELVDLGLGWSDIAEDNPGRTRLLELREHLPPPPPAAPEPEQRPQPAFP